MSKSSFWSKLTGSVPADEYDDLFDDERAQFGTARERTEQAPEQERHITLDANSEAVDVPQDDEVGELAVDVYQTDSEIVIKALVAGIQPQNVDISLTRDTVTVRGSREEHKEVEEDGYVHKELFWGGFARTVVLPDEVDVDAADATVTHGILLIRLPKVNKDRKTKVKVRTR